MKLISEALSINHNKYPGSVVKVSPICMKQKHSYTFWSILHKHKHSSKINPLLKKALQNYTLTMTMSNNLPGAIIVSKCKLMEVKRRSV